MHDEIINILKATLGETRFAHTIGVCESAVSLAARYGANKEQAYLAALLHDCARGLSYEETIAYCEINQVKLDEYLQNDFNPVHALVGADMAKRQFGIEDEMVVQAIKHHATGCENMTLLDKVLFVADAIEPNRAGPDVDDARQAAERSLNEAIPFALHVKTRYLRATNGTMHPNSINMLKQTVGMVEDVIKKYWN